jgi:hypothetical protein
MYKFKIVAPLGQSIKLCYHDRMVYFSPEEILSWDRECAFFNSAWEKSDELLSKGLYPPLPIRGKRLIWGFPLVERARSLGLEKIACRDFPAISVLEQMKLALLLENRAGMYDWREKARLACFAEKHGLSGAGSGITALIENNDDAAFWRKVKRYLDFPPALKALLDKKLIDFKTAEKTASLPEEFFALVLARGGNLTFSERRMFCTYIFEIVQRDGRKPPQAEKMAGKFLRLPQPLVGAAAERYPQLTALETQFRVFKEKHLKSSGISLAAPPYFEGGSFSLGFTFGNKKQYEKKLGRLARIGESIDELFGLLH